MRWLAIGITTASITLLAGAASAQTGDGFSLDRFQPSPAGDRFFGVQGDDPGGHGHLRLMLLGDYAWRPLVMYANDGADRVGNVVSHQLFGHAAASLALFESLVVSFDVPVALVTEGDSPQAGALAIASPSGAAFGDIRLGARYTFVGQPRSAATLGLGAYVFLPTGDPARFAGESGVRGLPALVLSGETDDFAYAANVGAVVRGSKDLGATRLGSELTFGAAAGLLFAGRKVHIGPEIYGTTTFDNAFVRDTTNLEAILGLRARAGDFVLGAGAGPGLTHGLGTPALRAVASVSWVPQPEEKAAPPPEAVVVAAPSDRDGDGIIDSEDACPDVKGKKTDDPKTNGCPPDRDGDGIIDVEDACPDVKGVKNADPQKNGCPPDRDGDGIIDVEDACPDVKGVKSEDPKRNGCPVVQVTKEEIIILDQVQFKTASDVILPASDELLTNVATVLKEHAEIQKIEVQGHTDNKGGAAYNRDLSRRRAASVMKWLTTRGGVDKARLMSAGYGMDKPIADNNTEEGRTKNRRVQFKIVGSDTAEPRKK